MDDLLNLNVEFCGLPQWMRDKMADPVLNQNLLYNPRRYVTRRWTPKGKKWTHVAIIGCGLNPDTDESIECILVEHSTREDANLAARSAIREGRYGELHVFRGGHPILAPWLGFGVHPPRMKIDGPGLISLDMIKSFLPII